MWWQALIYLGTLLRSISAKVLFPPERFIQSQPENSIRIGEYKIMALCGAPYADFACATN